MNAYDTSLASAVRRLPLPEFTAMLAMLFATLAFSIDAMLPSLSAIAADLTPDAVNRAQLIIPAFMAGMGIGTLFAGPISDAVGRKPAIAGGMVLYIIGAILAHFATSLEFLLVARVIQGLGSAGPRIAGTALARDLYEGRDMARVMSIVMTVFMVVPALAPAIGSGIIYFADWRAIFLAFIIFGVIALAWVSVRQPETLPPAARRRLSAGNISAGLKEVLATPEVRLYTLVIALGFGQMLALLSSIQPIFEITYDRAAQFPLWFALIAAISALTSFMNSRLVVRLGMRRMAASAFAAQACISLGMVALFGAGVLSGGLAFALFFVWAASIFCIAGLTFGNLNALAMQKMGHLAGMASSVISAVSTVLAVVIAGPVGQAFNGTPVPVMMGGAVCSTLAYLLMIRARKL